MTRSMTWFACMKNPFVRLLALSLQVILTLFGINESAGRGVMEEELFDRHRVKNAFYPDDRLLTIIDGATR